ncbi:hypothetical protein DB347_18825 [Opitutaceae bacterium EW11]|nr:hypothetical protein DB347_18825 [Opitutaceae bacterium EW11]
MKKILLITVLTLAASAPAFLIAELVGIPGLPLNGIEAAFAAFAIAGLLLNTTSDYAYRRPGHSLRVSGPALACAASRGICRAALTTCKVEEACDQAGR